jgi:hypothetical protein
MDQAGTNFSTSNEKMIACWIEQAHLIDKHDDEALIALKKTLDREKLLGNL